MTDLVKKLILFTFLFALPGCGKSTRFYNLELNDDRQFLQKGQNLAEKHCTSCHGFIHPRELPRENWNYILAYMGIMLGINDTRYIAHDRAYVSQLQDRKNILGYLNQVPTSPRISDNDWWAVRNYYLYEAPEEVAPANERLKDFSRFSHQYLEKTFGAVTCIAYNEEFKEILVGYGFTNRLVRYDNTGRLLESYQLPGPPIQVHFVAGGFYLTIIGDLFGRMVDPRPSKVLFYQRGLKGYKSRVVLDKLPRTAHTEFLDLDGDSDLDIIFSFFKGYGEGGLWLYENRGNDRYRPRPLVTGGSPVQSISRDFDNDGELDIAVLFSNINEKLSILYGTAGGSFNEQVVSQKHAAYGFVSMAAADLDQNGKVDLVTSNGDNSDNGPYNTLKPYHGIRIFYNRGDRQFNEKHLPLQGATIVKVADMNGDGQTDIIATANFADFSADRPASLVYLENNNGEFTYHTAGQNHRFSIVTVADLNGDKAPDLVAGTADFAISMIKDKKARAYEFDKKRQSMLLFLQK